ncbi:hypothetical protein GCM10010191_35280 [Actinomadura vinacea]|uniref:Protein kinase domain-containing protein n=1 Tax=Actinomadura vinacea TaxID=115336 RepID=A0ABN3J4S5_9ACTN
MTRSGQHIPGYVEVQELGAGTQGRVVLARHEVTGGHVAIKYLASRLLGDTRARETFRSEAELLKRVANPHVARLLNYVEAPEGAAIVMEAVPGRSLRAVLNGHDRPLEPEAALTILKGSLQGLAAAHAVGVIHRDYKPANVLIQDDGQSKLIDFGVAVLSGQGNIMGTPAYMAPEQWEGAPATPATDVYAATCVLYECLTGHKPYYLATTQAALRAHHITAPVPIDELPEPLRPLVAQGMAKNPGRRHWDIVALLSELDAVASATYGSDWERRGLVSLCAAAAVLAATLPVAMLGGALTPGALIAPGAQAAGEAGRVLGGKGLLAKIGGAKGAGGAAAGTAAAVMIGLYFWPEGPGVGGTSTGDYRAYFTRPSVVLANASIPDGDNAASPLVSEKITITPARAKPGTRVRVDIIWHARTPWGLQYLGRGNFRCLSPNSERADAYHRGYSFGLGEERTQSKDTKKPDIWLYRTNDKSPNDIPTGTPVRVQGNLAKQHDQEKYYDNKHCSWTFNASTTIDFAVPLGSSVTPGKYRLSRYYPVGIGQVKVEVNRRLTTITPASAGARVEGSLPALEVLES